MPSSKRKTYTNTGPHATPTHTNTTKTIGNTRKHRRVENTPKPDRTTPGPATGTPEPPTEQPDNGASHKHTHQNDSLGMDMQRGPLHNGTALAYVQPTPYDANCDQLWKPV